MKDVQLAALSPEAKKLYTQTVKQWSIKDAAGLKILLTACQSLDRMRSAQACIERDGITVLDRFRQAKPNPCIEIEKTSRAGFLLAMKNLDLDLESLDLEGQK